jgi:putative transposase
MKAHRDEFPVSVMCPVLQVSRSGYYAWLKRPESNRKKEDKELIAMIEPIFKEGRGAYGARRIRKKLAMQGRNASRKRVEKLMALAGLSCKTRRKFKVTRERSVNCVKLKPYPEAFWFQNGYGVAKRR